MSKSTKRVKGVKCIYSESPSFSSPFETFFLAGIPPPPQITPKLADSIAGMPWNHLAAVEGWKMYQKQFKAKPHMMTPQERLDRFTNILAEAVVRHLVGNQEQKTDHETAEPEPGNSVDKPL